MPNIRALAAALAVGAAGVLVVPVAAHAAAPPVVNWAHSDFDNDYGTLLVSASAGAGVSSINAHLRAAGGGPEIAATDTFTLRSGTATDGVWASAPILLDDLGIYTVDVEVVDADGTAVRQDDAGELYYAVRTFFQDIRLNRTHTTYDKRTVTMRGTLLGQRPGSGAIAPVAGATVTVLSMFDNVNTTTKPDGSFAGAVRIGQESEDVLANYGLTLPMHTRASSERLRVTISPRPVRVTVDLDRNKVDRGDPVTATGQVSWRAGGVWVPLAGVEAFVSHCASTEVDSCDYLTSVVTDADGRFTLAITPQVTGYIGVTYVRYTEDGIADPYVQLGFGHSRLLTVLPTAAFTEFQALRDDQGRIGVQGAFAFTGGRSPAHFTIGLQYSANGVDGWTTNTTVTDERSFASTGIHMPGAVFWRAFYPGETGFRRTVSEVVAVPAL